MGAVHGHRIRHASATGIREVGGTLIEPRELLVHVRTDTTMIYARKDLATLRSLTVLFGRVPSCSPCGQLWTSTW